jgi:predicted Zn-dependent peptidase
VAAAVVAAVGAASVELKDSPVSAGARGILPAGAGAQLASGMRGDDAAPSRTVLPNGLTVVSTRVPGVRSAALGAWVRAGSVLEKREQMGVSHMLEHMVFKGTHTRSARELATALESLGGSLDAYTTREHTSYQARVLDEHLPQAADVLFDLIFRPALRESDLELERKVVLEEISMVDDTPDDLVFELHNDLLWGGHPYGWPILGTRESVNGMRVADLRALHEAAYTPDRIVVAAAGNVEHDRLLDVLAAAGWADLEPSGAGPLIVPPLVSAPAARRHERRPLSQTHVVLGSSTVAYSDPRRYAVSLVGTALGGGMSSRLFQRVREELGLAYSVYTFQSFHVDVGIHGVYVATAPETAEEAVGVVEAELEQVSAEGLTEQELLAGKNQMKGAFTFSMESVSARMYRAAAMDLYGVPYRSLDEVLAIVEALTPDDAAGACRDFFAPSRQSVQTLGPLGAADASAA